MRTFASVLIVAAISTTAAAYPGESDTNDVGELKRRIERLEAELKKVTLERDALKKKLDVQQAGKVGKKPDRAPLGSAWEGTLTTTHLKKQTTSTANIEVTARDDKNITLRCSIENGAIWEFDCRVSTDHKLKIEKTRRARARDSLVNDLDLPPVGGVTGTGSAGTKKLTLRYVWQDAEGGPLSGEFEVKPTKEKSTPSR